MSRDNQIKRRTKEDQVHLSDVERFEYTLTPTDPKSNVSSAVVDNLTRYHTINDKEILGEKNTSEEGHHCRTYSMPLGFKQSRTELYDICHDAAPGH